MYPIPAAQKYTTIHQFYQTVETFTIPNAKYARIVHSLQNEKERNVIPST
jgi:hypothetical protein